MKVIIAGCRDRSVNLAQIDNMLAHSGFQVSEVVSGGAMGIDRSGEYWAKFRNFPVKRFRADWETHGRSAGPKRNANMAEYADALLAFWDGKSRGTQSMISEMRRAKKPYVVLNIDTNVIVEEWFG